VFRDVLKTDCRPQLQVSDNGVSDFGFQLFVVRRLDGEIMHRGKRFNKTQTQGEHSYAQLPISVTFCLPVAVALTTEENDVRWEKTGFLFGTNSRDSPLDCWG
jgi:hypothetical protein